MCFLIFFGFYLPDMISPSLPSPSFILFPSYSIETPISLHATFYILLFHTISLSVCCLGRGVFMVTYGGNTGYERMSKEEEKHTNRIFDSRNFKFLNDSRFFFVPSLKRFKRWIRGWNCCAVSQLYIPTYQQYWTILFYFICLPFISLILYHPGLVVLL